MSRRNSIDLNKTLKVSGLLKLLEDQLEKEFQSTGNSTGFHDDVAKLRVCQDYALVEFVNDLPSDPAAIGKTLTIGGTNLNVERSIATSDNSKSELFEGIWSTEGEEDGQSKGTKTQAIKKKSGREARQEKFNDHRPGLHSDLTSFPGPDPKPVPFGETEVKLKKGFASKIKENVECVEILKKENVKLQSKKMKGPWNGIYHVGQWLLSQLPNFGLTQHGYDEDEEDDQSGGSPSAIDQSAQSKNPDESFSVSSLFLRYIIAYHYAEYQKLESVSKEISFEVAESITDRNLNLFARTDVEKETFCKTVNDFIDFYQTQNQKMHQEIIPVPLKNKNGLIAETQTKFSVVIDISQGSDKMIIYGERDNVQEAVKILKGKAGDSVSTTSDSPKPAGATGGRSSKVPTGSSSTHEKSETVEKFSCVLFQHVKVSVYQGDISKETADVIVNPANERLKHSAGAAEAIVKAGGQSIQDESDEIMKKRRYYDLSPGQVVATKAGKLPCNLIVHAVGPRWDNYQYYQKDTAKNVLFSAVLNSLTIASQNGATSISMPAISSGIFGVPLQICAESLFTAATKFAKTASSLNPLKDIRFVNIDKKTTQAFAQEMKKRFGPSVRQENIKVFHSNNDGGNAWVDQHAQSQFNEWEQNPTSNARAIGAAGPTNVSYAGGHDSRSGSDDKGNPGGKSNLNPNASEFSTTWSNSSSTPTSYSGAVTKGSDKKRESDPKSGNKEECSICLFKITDRKTLDKCGHSFCTGCIDEAFKHQKKCPLCFQVYGRLTGNQPPGKMIESYQSTSLSGFRSCGTIVITYIFEGGTQGPNHPNPGKPYSGTRRTAYLPDNEEGRKVLGLLKKAFHQKLTFTIGRSSTLGTNNVITWNDIHHKTRPMGGTTNYGYPDPDYLKRVQEELAAKGITE